MSDISVDDEAPSTSHPSLLELEIPRQPAVLDTAAAAFAGPVARLLRQVAERSADDWVVTGCGDSFFAGICAEVWFARRAGRRLRPVHAMHLARETYGALGPASVVLAVSHSGTTARVLEAARAARMQGAFVVAVTSNGQSELARASDVWIDNCVRDERSNCRTASFQAVSLLMRMIADGLGATTGHDLRPPQLSLVQPHIESARRQVDAMGSDVLLGDHWIFTGSGLGLAVAEYGMAKAYEAATLPAHSVELEQFIHCEIFTVHPGTRVVMVASAGRASSRAVELAEGLRKLGAVTIAITDDEELSAAAAHVLPLPGDLHEDDLPFVGVLPLQWLALRLAMARGENPDLVANKWVNRPLIDDSALWDPRSTGPEVRA